MGLNVSQCEQMLATVRKFEQMRANGIKYYGQHKAVQWKDYADKGANCLPRGMACSRQEECVENNGNTWAGMKTVVNKQITK